MLTEDEARKKWCPFVRLASARDNDPVSFNRTVDEDGAPSMRRPVLCIASECMAWRTVTKTHEDVPTPTSGGSWYMQRQELETPIIGGFCGLAGKP